MDVAWIAQFAASGWLEPLAPYLDTSVLSADDFFKPVIRTAAIYEGALISLPVYIDGGLLYYRKDLLEKYGISKAPATWDELVSTAKTVIEKETAIKRDLTGFVWQGAQYEGLVCTFLEFAASNGGGITLGDSLPIVATKRNREALSFMRRLIHVDKISPVNISTDMKEEEVRLAFQKGDVLFERNWPYAWKLHQADDSPVKGKTGITVLPHFKGGRSAATLGGWHIGLSRFSRRKSRAFSLIASLLSYDVQKASALELGWNPGRTDVYLDTAIIRALPHLETLRDVFSHAVGRPNVPYYSYLSAILQRHLNAAISGTVAVDAALDEAEKELRVIFNHYSKQQ